MAFDGAFLKHIKNEIESVAMGAIVGKIHQPSKEEFIFPLRTKSGVYKLLLSARANSSRVHFIQNTPENPSVPPMLCMLFRKKLSGAKLINICQPALERVLFFDFEATNELGDKVMLTIAAEIMGKYSNIILIDGQGFIVDALKRVDFSMSSKRQVLPGVKYSLPPKQDKLSLFDSDLNQIIEKVQLLSKEKSLSDALLYTIQGVSPIVCQTIAKNISTSEDQSLKSVLEDLKGIIGECSGEPVMLYDNGRPCDFSFINIVKNQDANDILVKKYPNFSELLDAFFEQRDCIDRINVKSHDLKKQVNNILSRLRKKIKVQTDEIKQSKSKENMRVFADLINANLYKIPQGTSEIMLENFYDENLSKVKIKLNPCLTAAKNAQNFYKEYRKAKVAQEVLSEEINKANAEIIYMESVLDALNRARSETELLEIKNELFLQGYVNHKKLSVKKQAPLAPIEYKLNDNVRILVGRNNHQNDKLTLKTASKQDLWFHVKDIPGSHTILIADKSFINDDILYKTAQIAAYHSKAKDSANVPVDYALVKDVKKPSGAKPGRVIYNNYKTLYVMPCLNLDGDLSKNY